MLLRKLQQMASVSPERIALQGAHGAWSYDMLNQFVAKVAADLAAHDVRVLGLLADNGLPWVLADLSAMRAQVPLVPLPLFFSPQQMLHALRDAGVDALLTDQPQQAVALLQSAGVEFRMLGELCGLQLIRLPNAAFRPLPQDTAKITYTSGTSGEPKGVCLSLAQMETVAASLLDASQAQSADRHLCLTPLSTLLENIGGIYTPILAGACACVLPLQQVGLSGASGFDVVRMLLALHEHKISSAIMAPQMLQALVGAGESGVFMPTGLRFVAVGGAPVSPQLLQRARMLDLPVFEGYGLSECASVVALNTPLANRAGSVGRPLPHIAVSFSDEGEILLSGSAFLGYLGQECQVQPWPTGDLGYLDEDGFLHLVGRRKSMFITSFGRNVAPEWVERELILHPAIAQAAVFGESRPFNAAVIVARPGYSGIQIAAAVQSVNRMLPDYAQVSDWLLADAPFTLSNQQLTANGRLRRDAILAMYGSALAALYQEEMHVVL
ncbi:MAG: AMP-binding protein [Sulfuriferula sp.]|nr:AMP-binding protein [Sulfuriferula sp.]